ncbi:MAG: HEAT repeat domain-containing protein [Deltaproteobacteria bacterium]|nr:HEAT repeat domain-containing protein [Deltaproteobacteria bacterium]
MRNRTLLLVAAVSAFGAVLGALLFAVLFRAVGTAPPAAPAPAVAEGRPAPVPLPASAPVELKPGPAVRAAGHAESMNGPPPPVSASPHPVAEEDRPPAQPIVAQPGSGFLPDGSPLPVSTVPGRPLLSDMKGYLRSVEIPKSFEKRRHFSPYAELRTKSEAVIEATRRADRAALIAAMKDPDVADDAARNLATPQMVQADGRLQPDAKAAILEALDNPAVEPAAKGAIAAVLLGSVTDAEFPVIAVKLARHPTRNVRGAVVKWLGRAPMNVAVPLLAILLRDPDPEVAAMAVEAARLLTGQDFGDEPGAWAAWADGGGPK